MLPWQLPEDLQRLLDAAAIELEGALVRREYEKAADGYRALYTTLHSAQPPGQRFHKGYALHNIGYSLLFRGDAPGAYPLFVAAYVEDLLSRPPTEGGPPRDTPAAIVLTKLYEVGGDVLEAFDDQVLRTAQADPDLARDPIRLLSSIGIPETSVPSEAVLNKIGVQPAPGPLLEPGRFPVPWEDRVFVGGNYDFPQDITIIERIVRTHGKFPVVARHYRILEDDVHRTSLMLLHECRLAIFEISREAGQLMEIERTRDFGIKVLAVRQSADPNELRASGMVKALLKRDAAEVKTYQTPEELETIIADFLARNPYTM